jgi:hypothetical protein
MRKMFVILHILWGKCLEFCTFYEENVCNFAHFMRKMFGILHILWGKCLEFYTFYEENVWNSRTTFWRIEVVLKCALCGWGVAFIDLGKRIAVIMFILAWAIEAAIWLQINGNLMHFLAQAGELVLTQVLLWSL